MRTDSIFSALRPNSGGHLLSLAALVVSLLHIVSAAKESATVKSGNTNGKSDLRAEWSSISRSVGQVCTDFESVRSLDAFSRFMVEYGKLNQCLHDTKSANELVLKECQQSEETCQRHGLLYASLLSIERLVGRLKSQERVCTIEFASQIYRLHRKLGLLGAPKGGMRILRGLALTWAAKCRKSVPARLLEVEQRAKDSVRHLKLILGIMSYGQQAEANLELSPEIYVPVLQEDMLDENLVSVGRGPNGFEYSLSASLRLALDGARMSCQALKPYYLNILGSLGLVASIGYSGTQLDDGSVQWTKSEQRRLGEWVMGAVLCQTIACVSKMGTLSVAGKAMTRIKVLPLREADVTPEDELDTTFASYHLNEAGEPQDLRVDLDTKMLELREPDPSSVLRRLQIIEGPNELLATAIFAYLDMKQPGRETLPYRILGVPVPTKTKAGGDDDDDNEEEEEEEEEE